MAARKKAVAEEPVEEAAEAKTEPVKEEPKMVTAKVVVTFKDKYTNKLWQAGEVLAVTEERFAEINSKHKHIVKA